MSCSSSLLPADLSVLLLSDVLIAPVWCPITSRKLCLWLSINLLHKSLQPGLLVRRQHPIGWAAVRRNRDEWQLTREKWGQCCCWIVWRTTDKLTTSVFMRHTRLGAHKWNWANYLFVLDENIYWSEYGWTWKVHLLKYSSEVLKYFFFLCYTFTPLNFKVIFFFLLSQCEANIIYS